jgi:hypothetical protein
MATYPSTKGYFEVTSAGFTPSVIPFGGEAEYSITVKNVSGKKITSMYAILRLHFKDASGAMQVSDYVYLHGGPAFEFASISWTSGASKTFKGKFSPTSYYKPTSESRLLDCYLSLDIVTSASFSDGSGSDIIYNLDGANGENLKVFDSRYVPTVSKFAAVRADGDKEDDEGENALTTVRLALRDGTYYNRLSLQFRYRDKAVGGAYKSIDISSYIGQALTADVVTTIIEKTIGTEEIALILGKNSDWELQLWFGDEFESVTAPLTDPFLLPRSFANVHLSGKKNGGVCFGSFSKATDENPLFQCYYPAEFEEGIKGGFTYESGEVRTGGKWIDGKKIYRYVFVGDSDNELPTLPFKISNLISASGTLKGSDGSFRPIPYSYYGSSNWTACFYVDGNNKINLQLGSGYAGKQTVIIILEYTKEADT